MQGSEARKNEQAVTKELPRLYTKERPGDAAITLATIPPSGLVERGATPNVLGVTFTWKSPEGPEVRATFQMTWREVQDLYSLLTGTLKDITTEQGRAAERLRTFVRGLQGDVAVNDPVLAANRVKLDPVSRAGARGELIYLHHVQPGEKTNPEAFIKTADLKNALEELFPDLKPKERID